MNSLKQKLGVRSDLKMYESNLNIILSNTRKLFYSSIAIMSLMMGCENLKKSEKK